MGYTVPTAFRDKFVETMKYYGPMLREAEVINTASGATLPWPTNDDTANVGALLAENTQVSEQDVTFGTANLDAYMYTSKARARVAAAIQDSAFDINTWLPKKLGERVGRILNQHFTTGTGVNQPDGIVTSATVGVTGTGSFATTGGIAYDNIVDIIEALDPAYSQGDGQKFMFHQSVRKALRKAQGRPEPATLGAEPPGGRGRPGRRLRVRHQQRHAHARGGVEVAAVRQHRAGVRRPSRHRAQTMRLTERYADFLQVGFLSFQRADGTMQDSAAVRVFQTTATA